MSRKAQQRRADKKSRMPSHQEQEDGTSEILDVLRLQSDYIDQVERENRLMKEELGAFRKRLDEVIRENQNLHSTVRSDAVHETINRAGQMTEDNQMEFAEQEGRQILHNHQSLHESQLAHEPSRAETLKQWTHEMVMSVFLQEFAEQEGRQILHNHQSLHESQLAHEPSRAETLKQWTHEMKNIKSIYEAKIEGLEVEVRTTKKDLQSSLNEAADLRERIRTLEALLKTPKHDAENPSFADLQKGSIALNANVPLIERLTKERDDLMKSLSAMRNSVMEAQKTETSLRQEMQKSMALVEDIQLEKAQTKVENNRLKKDLVLTRQRLENEILSAQSRISEATANQRKTCQDEINELAKKVGELTTISSMYEDTIQAASKEKATLSEQLQESKKQLLTANEDLGRMRSEIDHEVRSALKGYKGAEEELRATKTKLQEELARTKQERVRLEQEAIDQQRRLSAAQAEALASKELNITLTKQHNDVLNKIQRIKDERERVEKDLKGRLEDVQVQAESKETQLEDVIRKLNIENQHRLSDLENISSKQANLIIKLKDEGKAMETELLRVTKKYRKQLGSLSQDKDIATSRLNRMLLANKELEEQVVQHGITHREMQVRLRQLDERTRRTTGYAADVVEENDRLALDKSLLQKEVEFLQSQVKLFDTM